MGINDYYVVAKFRIVNREWEMQVLTVAGEFRSGLLPRRWKKLSTAEQYAANSPGSMPLYSRYFLDIWGRLIERKHQKSIPPASRNGVAIKVEGGWDLEIETLGIVHFENSARWNESHLLLEAAKVFSDASITVKSVPISPK